MKDLRATSGMAGLFVDGLDIGAVYYELNHNESAANGSIGGKLTGEPHALWQAYNEGGATLILRNGRKLPVVVTKIMNDEHTASVRLSPEVPLQE